MLKNKNIFSKKKILIYGLGKSGLSTFKFLKKNNEVYLYDDQKIKNNSIEIKKKTINFKEVTKKKVDYIIISPGINIYKCQLTNFLKKNLKK
jgi:UDP-N-acetylmuramoylalanine--D-glutamate ligase